MGNRNRHQGRRRAVRHPPSPFTASHTHTHPQHFYSSKASSSPWSKTKAKACFIPIREIVSPDRSLLQSILRPQTRQIVPPRSGTSKRSVRSSLSFSLLRYRLILKLSVQRQGLAYILVRQAISLLQRTQLNVSISCQAWHAKNSRHMLLDIVDFVEPTMVIVGSRGVGKLQG